MSQMQVSGESGLTDYESVEVDATQLTQLAGADGNGASAEAIAGNGFTLRWDWGKRSGQWKLALNWSGFTPDSRVFVSISEGHVGAARYTVHNVVPEAGRVTIWVNIEWSSPIQLFAEYMIVNP